MLRSHDRSLSRGLSAAKLNNVCQQRPGFEVKKAFCHFCHGVYLFFPLKSGALGGSGGTVHAYRAPPVGIPIDSGMGLSIRIDKLRVFINKTLSTQSLINQLSVKRVGLSISIDSR
jgi:hypothetical protein